jgi:alpha-tubulin suppressor-like RCC1 family protein
VPLDFVAILSGGTVHGPHFDVSPGAGTVGANSEATLVVMPATIPATSDPKEGSYHDDLYVLLSDGSSSVVTLAQHSEGAILGGPEVVNFGRVRIGTVGSELVTVKNFGNAPATVRLTGSAPFGGGAPVTVPAGGSADLPASFAPDPTKLGVTESGTLSIVTSDALCAAAPTFEAVAASVDRAKLVVAGGYHGCALGQSGYVYCWGHNNFGQVGDGTTVSRQTATPVTGLQGSVVGLSCGALHSCALLSNGRVMCWGLNTSGQLGFPAGFNATTPDFVGSLSDAVAVQTYNVSTCAIRQGGEVVCWGDGGEGALGTGAPTSSLTPVTVTGVSAVQLGGGNWTPCARDSTGAVKCWGREANGIYGSSVHTPLAIQGVTNAVDLGARGERHVCVARASGSVSCWGFNNAAQLGLGTSDGVWHDPLYVGTISNATQVASSAFGTCVRSSSGALQCWNVGYGLSPAPMQGITKAAAVAAGYRFFLVRRDDGTILSWGDNSQLQLGRVVYSNQDDVPSFVSGFD